MTAADALFIGSCVILVTALAMVLDHIGRRPARPPHAHPRRFWE